MQTATLFVLDRDARDSNSDAATAYASRVNATSTSHRVEVVPLTTSAALNQPLPSNLHGVPTLVLPDNSTMTGSNAMHTLSAWCVETADTANQVVRPPAAASAAPPQAIVEDK
jgi:hypothetical protein